MAGNDWVNSYLEAILDVGQPLDDARPSLLLRERGRCTPSRYFVEEFITGFDETDLHRSWVKAVATRSPQERNTRLENMCWRIWNLARQKKQQPRREEKKRDESSILQSYIRKVKKKLHRMGSRWLSILTCFRSRQVDGGGDDDGYDGDGDIWAEQYEVIHCLTREPSVGKMFPPQKSLPKSHNNRQILPPE